MTRYARRTDANHAVIRDGLRAKGWQVLDLSGAGDGIPDLACSLAPGTPFFLELKDGDKLVSAQKLTKAQETWHSFAWGITAKVRSLDEAMEVLTWARNKL